MFKLSKDLIFELNKNQIIYCHWKSNVNIKKALGGYDDLDILVKRADLSKFYQVLASLNFKEASNKKLNIQSVRHFYGLDSSSGKILHLHIYNQILTGPSWTKSYLFDLTNEYFNIRKEKTSDIPLPPKSVELLIFVFRIYLKLSSGLEFISTYRQRSQIINEIKYLDENLDTNSLKKLLKNYFPLISYNDFESYKRCLNNGNLIRTIKNSIILRFKLRKYQVYPIHVQIFKSFNQLFYRIFNKIFFKQKKKLQNGGVFIAVTGLDASGKSSMIKKLNSWLSTNFTVVNSHFGKPKSTFLTFPITLIYKIFKIFKKKRYNNNYYEAKPKTSFIYVVRQLSLAYDRYCLAIKIKRKAAKGNIILCDRYKSENYCAMDSKRLDPSNFTFIKYYLAKIENLLYESIPKPDLIINLTVPINVAVKRNKQRKKKDKETEEALRYRHSKNNNLTYKSDLVYNIDTNKDYTILVNQVKNIVWNNL